MSSKEATDALVGVCYLLVRLQNGYDKDSLERICQFVSENRSHCNTVKALYKAMTGFDEATCRELDTILA